VGPGSGPGEAVGQRQGAVVAAAAMQHGRNGQRPLGAPDGQAAAVAEHLHQGVEWRANIG
jgi:hypothetical protein